MDTERYWSWTWMSDRWTPFCHSWQHVGFFSIIDTIATNINGRFLPIFKESPIAHPVHIQIACDRLEAKKVDPRKVKNIHQSNLIYVKRQTIYSPFDSRSEIQIEKKKIDTCKVRFYEYHKLVLKILFDTSKNIIKMWYLYGKIVAHSRNMKTKREDWKITKKPSPWPRWKSFRSVVSQSINRQRDSQLQFLLAIVRFPKRSAIVDSRVKGRNAVFNEQIPCAIVRHFTTYFYFMVKYFSLISPIPITMLNIINTRQKMLPIESTTAIPYVKTASIVKFCSWRYRH